MVVRELQEIIYLAFVCVALISGLGNLQMECSAKKGGEDISGDAGIFGKVVDRVRFSLS